MTFWTSLPLIEFKHHPGREGRQKQQGPTEKTNDAVMLAELGVVRADCGGNLFQFFDPGE
jgi:hypothetical protein